MMVGAALGVLRTKIRNIGRSTDFWWRKALETVWQYRWACALSGILMSPVIIHDVWMAARAGGVDELILFSIPASVCALLAVHLWVRRVWLAHLCLAPFYILVLVDLFMIAKYDVRLSSSSASVLFENWGDAGPYLRSHYPGILTVVGPILLVIGFGISRLRRLVVPATRQARILAFGALLGIYCAVSLKQSLSNRFSLKYSVLDVMSHDRSVPLGFLSQGIIAFDIYRETRQHRLSSQRFQFGAKQRSGAPEEAIYVFVMGESSRPDHWSLYGYERETNPRLARERNLVVFQDVVTQAGLTQIAVPMAITRATAVDSDRASKEKSVVGAFREAGFQTYWLSTQQRDQWTGALNNFSAEAHVQRFFEQRHDERLVEEFNRALDSEKDAGGKSFFILHTQGSHFVFEDRYPKDFRHFSANPASSRRERTVNTYDDSVLYTDYVLYRLIEALRLRKVPAVLFYVSDHGENLYDDSRDLFGHFLNNEYDLPVPMFLWYSDEYERSFPEKLAAARANADQAVTTDVVFHTLVDMGHIEIADELRGQSLMDGNFERSPRMVLQDWKPVEYDRWLKSKVCRDAKPPPFACRTLEKQQRSPPQP